MIPDNIKQFEKDDIIVITNTTSPMLEKHTAAIINSIQNNKISITTISSITGHPYETKTYYYTDEIFNDVFADVSHLYVINSKIIDDIKFIVDGNKDNPAFVKRYIKYARKRIPVIINHNIRTAYALMKIDAKYKVKSKK